MEIEKFEQSWRSSRRHPLWTQLFESDLTSRPVFDAR